MRYIASYRYSLINNLDNKKVLCSTWKDVYAKTGITRSSLNLLLNGKYIDKFKHWSVSRCNIKKLH